MRSLAFVVLVACAACSKPAENAAAPASPPVVNASHDPRQFPGMVKSAQDAAVTANALNAKTEAQTQSAGE